MKWGIFKKVIPLVLTAVLFTPTKLYPVLGVADTAIVHDPINSAIQRVRDMAATAHEEFMKLKVVVMAKTMYDNYIQSVKYYEMAKSMSEHQGGFLGYLHDYTAGQFDLVKEEQIKMFKKIKEGDDDNDVNRALSGYSKKLSDKISNFGKFHEEYQSYGEKMAANAEKRNKDILNTFNSANKPMDTKGMQEIQVKLAVHQTQVLMDMESMVRARELMNIKKEQDEIRGEKEEYVNMLEMLKAAGTMAKNVAVGSKKNPYDELRKTPLEK